MGDVLVPDNALGNGHVGVVSSARSLGSMGRSLSRSFRRSLLAGVPNSIIILSIQTLL